MKFFFSWILFSIIMILAGCGGNSDSSDPVVTKMAWDDLCGAEIGDYETSRISEVPDFLQTGTEFGTLPNGGQEYCVPAAVSNSLMWLRRNGYPRLGGGDSGDPDRDQFEMVRQLGADYLQTDPVSGTHLYNLLYGVRDYLEDHGYRGELSFQGWLYHAPEFTSGIEVPRLDCLRGGIAADHPVWLLIGFYDFDRSRDRYTRIGSHMVTAVGYDFDGTDAGAGELIVHDPSPRAGLSFRSNYFRPVPLAAGTLYGPYHGLPRSAAGFHRLDGIALPREVDLAILDGVVLLSMNPAAY